MSDRAIVGTPVKLTVDGCQFDPTADADPGDGKPRYETAAEITSGRTFFKKTRQDQNVSGFSVRVTGNQLELLKAIAERLEPYPMSYTNAAGDVYKAQGMISYSERKNQTGSLELTLMPDEKGWVKF